jgi:hypothetical protein
VFLFFHITSEFLLKVSFGTLLKLALLSEFRYPSESFVLEKESHPGDNYNPRITRACINPFVKKKNVQRNFQMNKMQVLLSFI